ncbi:somatostatin receptor type 2-like [Saccoglossus kowalevskii]|uniref:Somatostatin receptor type 2-like n=1 Tax=Saccoglossus kowalevskii TaxID=10224 RepID=A0ABM0GWR6_SACKO|nr:PREDICTED: somatostatin receptor type 2-like [Saccoglossus kowalevskii]
MADENFTTWWSITTESATDTLSKGNVSELLNSTVETYTPSATSLLLSATEQLVTTLSSWNVTPNTNGTTGSMFSPPPNDNGSWYPALPDWWATLNDRIGIILPICYGIIFGCGFIGNLLVILVLTKYSSMKTLPNIYILNLSIADFLFMFTIPFLSYQFIANKWIFGAAMCKIVMAFDGMNQFTGVFLLTAMSLDRYVAFVHPMKSLRIRTVRTTRTVCVTMWVLSALVCLPLWMYTKSDVSRYDNNTVCLLDWPEEVAKSFLIYAFLLGYVLPLIIISCCYFIIVKQILTSKQPGGNTSGVNRKGSRRVAMLVIVAVVTFAVCWLPFYATQLHFAFFLEGFPSMAAMISNYASICLSYGNSVINPIIYTFVGRNFKTNILRLLRCQGDSYKRSQSTYLSGSRATVRQQRNGTLNPTGVKNVLSTVSVNDSPTRSVDMMTFDNSAFKNASANTLAAGFSQSSTAKVTTNDHKVEPKSTSGNKDTVDGTSTTKMSPVISQRNDALVTTMPHTLPRDTESSGNGAAIIGDVACTGHVNLAMDNSDGETDSPVHTEA